MLGTFLLPYITNQCCLCIRFHPKTPKYNVFAVKTQGIFKNSMETQEFLKTQGQNSPQNCKNSRFRKLHLPTVPKKRLKKIPDIEGAPETFKKKQ